MNLFKANSVIYQAPIIYNRDAFYVFGGDTDINFLVSQTIAKLDANLDWSKVGELRTGRKGHNFIFDGNAVLFIRGEGNKQT